MKVGPRAVFPQVAGLHARLDVDLLEPSPKRSNQPATELIRPPVRPCREPRRPRPGPPGATSISHRWAVGAPHRCPDRSSAPPGRPTRSTPPGPPCRHRRCIRSDPPLLQIGRDPGPGRVPGDVVADQHRQRHDSPQNQAPASPPTPPAPGPAGSGVAARWRRSSGSAPRVICNIRRGDHAGSRAKLSAAAAARSVPSKAVTVWQSGAAWAAALALASCTAP